MMDEKDRPRFFTNCPVCSAETPPGSINCPNCGVDLEIARSNFIKDAALAVGKYGFEVGRQTATPPEPAPVKKKIPIMGIIFLFFLCLLFYGFIKDTIILPVLRSTAYNPTPHRTATSYRPSTITPVPVSASPTSSSTCLLWSQVTSSMAGRTLCVYGTVIEYRENWENYISNLYFGTRDQFYLVSNYRWDDSPKGDCVTATGEVQLNTYKVPYIKIEDQLDSCQ